MQLIKIEQLPLTFHKATITETATIKKAKKEHFILIKKIGSDKISTEKFYKPISKIFSFDED
ncbi:MULTISPECIES: hypothetical protein [Kordia]|uniref:hypothetical protein n=1 Tax=Kordia TaxID=221065 RepID=UPI0006291FA9|nr:hypothetical protein [Kordia jejudonensis]